MTKINIDLTSTITQEKDSETFHKNIDGEIKKDDKTIRVSYLEDGTIPVKMLLKDNELILRRGALMPALYGVLTCTTLNIL